MPPPALSSLYQSLGVTLAKYGHCLMPEKFGDLAEECRAARAGVALLDASDRAWIEVTGADRKRFLHGMTTNDVNGLAPGGGCAATMVSAKGKLLADLAVLCREDRYLLTTRGDLGPGLLAGLGRFIIADDVELTDRSAAWTAFDLLGPRADAVLAALAPGFTLPAGEFAHAEARIAGRDVRAIRSSPVWGPGVELVVEAAGAREFWEALRAAGAAHGLVPIGAAALEVLRVEAGVPWFGVDMDESTLPVEAGLEARAISYAKGCYVGQEIIARIKTYGEPAKRLYGLRLTGERLPARGARLTDAAGAEIGRVTSAVRSPACGPIALAYVQRGRGGPGVRCAAQDADGPLAAEIVKLPFVP
ncbi:MAG: aminomethyl transferase family protein [Planctomycetes bacterium]|nr:aminomethyl transferase family protein [Planctomycetota bacterium]